MSKIIAHRGFVENGLVENTLPAFTNAIRKNADMLELDVHLLKDNNFFVYHDNQFFGKKINNSTSIEILSTAKKQSYPTTFLIDILEELTTVPIIIELKSKSEAAGREVVKLLERTGRDLDCFVASFHEKSLRGARLQSSDIHLVWNEYKPVRQLWREIHGKLGLTYLSLYYRFVNPRVIDRAMQYDLKVFAWTINSIKLLNKFLQLPLEGIITDKLELGLNLRDAFSQ